MDLNCFITQLRQSLENYERCGVTHLSHSLRGRDLSPELTQALELLYQAEPVTPPAENRVSNSSVSKSQVAVEQPLDTSPERRSASSVAAEPALPSSTGTTESWSLPVLSLPEREKRFLDLDAQVKACRKCTEIVNYRYQTVFGEGSLQPELCFIGEAPGADEDKQGRPFVGRAGQLLTKIINAMGLQREQVYILNSLKCRPPSNRTPMPEEISNCHDFVAAQLEILQPKYIVCLGAVAVRSILRTDSAIGRLRGRFHSYRDAKVVVTYHPAYLLRQENAKRKTWEDMQMLMRDMGLEIPSSK